MANAFGFARFPQQPSPDPSAVGAQLMQQRQAPQVPQPVGVTPGEQVATSFRPDEVLRMEGGKLAGSGGPDVSGGLNSAIGEALTRVGGGLQNNPNPNKPKARNMAQLRQLGLSDVEVMLLSETGGI